MMQKAGYGWLGLTAYVAAYDIWAAKTKRETLSRTFYTALSNPVQRIGIITVWGVTTLHLFGFLPDKYDPFDILGEIIVGRTEPRGY